MLSYDLTVRYQTIRQLHGISRFMEYTILSVRWIGSSRGQFGVVAFEADEGEWLATIGEVKDTHSAAYSAQDIAAWGAKLLPQEAHGFFPELDVTKYKDYASLATAVRG